MICICGLVLLFVVWEVAAFDVCYILFGGDRDFVVEIEVAAEEAGGEVFGDA